MQFPPDTVQIEAFGRFAREVREELPIRQRQPVVPPMVESFDVAAVTPPIQFHLEDPASLPRIWFQSEDGHELVQLQPDRLTLNWREMDREAEYPRYASLRGRLEELLKRLTDGLDDIGQLHEINLCEVTYVNPIGSYRRSAPPKPAEHADLASIINRLRRRPRGAFLTETEDAQLQARWRIPSEELPSDGRPIGRLYLTATPGLKPPKNTPIYLVNLTARVIPSSGANEDAMEALDVAHKWVVLGFKDLTTNEMHRRWGLKEDQP